ncbi:MAG: DUF2510 domain-containing protein [Solirubrobacterales bacterium]
MEAANAATSASSAGWHPDPHGTGMLRWWDGMQWTQHTHAMPVQQPVAAAVQQPIANAFDADAYLASQSSANNVSGIDLGENSRSLVAIVIAIGYVVLSLTTGIVLLGIVPGVMAFRAFEKGEKLAPLAALAAVAAVVFAFTSVKGP